MLIDYLKFFAAFTAVFFLPGFSVLYLFRRLIRISTIEYFVLSVGSSIGIVNLAILAMNKLGMPLTASNIANALVLIIAVPLVLSTFPSVKTFFPRSEEKKGKQTAKKTAAAVDNPPRALLMPKKMTTRILLTGIVLLAIGFLITARYLAKDIVPNNTDLGHHMYWTEIMRSGEKIPVYDTDEVIVGEHIPFMVMAVITGLPVLSAYPVITLMFINAVALLAAYALFLRVSGNQKTAFLALGFAGVLYAVAAPMAKFVGGGVVGNIFGNLFIPLTLLTLYLSFAQKKSEFLFLAIFFTQSIFYIHHLSTFLLLFIIGGTLLFYIAAGLREKSARKNISVIFKLGFSPLPLLAVALFLFTLGYIYVPSYISGNSVATVAQAPTKDTHLGISVASFISSTGDWRSFLGIAGLIFFFYLAIVRKTISRFGASVMLSWNIILLILSFYPRLLMVDLPSRRVANYIALPFSFLAAYALIVILSYIHKGVSRRTYAVICLVLGISLFLNGYGDSLGDFPSTSQSEQTVQVYHASEYLASHTTESDVILKDHANITADSWMKFFFLRGYNYLLTRTFDYKYLDPVNSGRETCTREMIISPDSEEGLDCYKKTGVSYVLLQKDFDNFFFDASENFGKIYENNAIAIYKRSALSVK